MPSLGFYVGYAGTRTLDQNYELQSSDRQAFFKASYAFRR